MENNNKEKNINLQKRNGRLIIDTEKKLKIQLNIKKKLKIGIITMLQIIEKNIIYLKKNTTEMFYILIRN